MMTTWEKELKGAFKSSGDDFTKMKCTLSETELQKEFDDGFGGSNGKPFTAWGKKYVYFPVVYDGSEWAGYAPRNPCKESTEHQGGE